MTHLNIPVTYERLLNLLQVRPGFGASAANIRHLEKLNLEVSSYRQFWTFEDLLAWLDRDEKYAVSP